MSTSVGKHRLKKKTYLNFIYMLYVTLYKDNYLILYFMLWVLLSHLLFVFTVKHIVVSEATVLLHF